MTYSETIQYLYDCVPMFQKVGANGYKEGLDNTLAFDKHFGHPHRNFKTIHIAGTNGKGSCSHTIASILQAAGYKVGLYTSPHLVDFRERIRINGEMISEKYVIDFVEKEKRLFETLHPSFFEVTTTLAFKYFYEMKVDVAVIEVGLGGRLDCTNIISPILSIITNISFDHTQFLGHSLSEIANEKAGIIKPGTPVIIGEAVPETKNVFITKAREVETEICFAEEKQEILSSHTDHTDGYRVYETASYGEIRGELVGLCQDKNTNTILNAIPFIKKNGFNISKANIDRGFSSVCKKTGLMGRWQKISNVPLTICDTGHNEGGFKYISRQLEIQEKNTGGVLRIVFGMVKDKDITKVLSMLPQKAVYYFTKASIERALDEHELATLAKDFGLNGSTYPTVSMAYEAARTEASPKDFIFIGGSSFVVADLLASINQQTGHTLTKNR